MHTSASCQGHANGRGPVAQNINIHRKSHDGGNAQGWHRRVISSSRKSEKPARSASPHTLAARLGTSPSRVANAAARLLATSALLTLLPSSAASIGLLTEPMSAYQGLESPANTGFAEHGAIPTHKRSHKAQSFAPLSPAHHRPTAGQPCRPPPSLAVHRLPGQRRGEAGGGGRLSGGEGEGVPAGAGNSRRRRRGGQPPDTDPSSRRRVRNIFGPETPLRMV